MTHDPAPDVNASTYRAKAAHDADLRPAPILTPGQALAAAAVLEVHGPHHERMAAIIQALSDYGNTARREEADHVGPA